MTIYEKRNGRIAVSFWLSLKLSLRELRSTTSFLQAVLLSFLCTRVTRKEACRFEYGTAVFFRFEKRARHAKTDSTRLTRVTAADYVYEYVVLALCFNGNEGLLYDILQSTLGEIVFKSAVVDYDRTIAAGD